MIRAIRRLGWVFGILVVLLAINLTFQQFLLAPRINAEPGNQRTVLAEYERERGPILVGTKPVARSIATPSRRTSSCAPIPTVFCAAGHRLLLLAVRSHRFGTAGERHPLRRRPTAVRRPDRATDRRAGARGRCGADDPAGLRTEGRSVGSGSQIGSVTAIDPKTGAILALVQSPSFDPNGLARTTPRPRRTTTNNSTRTPDKPLLNRPLVQTIPGFHVQTRDSSRGSGRRLRAGFGAARPGVPTRCPARQSHWRTGRAPPAAPTTARHWPTPLRSLATAHSPTWATTSGQTHCAHRPGSSVSNPPSTCR